MRLLLFLTIFSLLFLGSSPLPTRAVASKWGSCIAPLSGEKQGAAPTEFLIEGIQELRLVSEESGKVLVNTSVRDSLFLSDLVGEQMSGKKFPRLKLQLVLSKDSATRIPFGKKLLFSFWLRGRYCRPLIGCWDASGQWERFRYLNIQSDQFALGIEEGENLIIDLPLSSEKLVQKIWEQRCNLKYAVAGLKIEGFDLESKEQSPKPFFRVVRPGKIDGSRENNGAWPPTISCTQDPPQPKK